jgi:hypothetical protein
MCNEPAGFHTEEKVRGRNFAPSQQGIFGREFVKRIVYFDGVVVADIPAEHGGTGQFGGIKKIAPVFVMPAGGTDSELRIHSSPMPLFSPAPSLPPNLLSRFRCNLKFSVGIGLGRAPYHKDGSSR